MVPWGGGKSPRGTCANCDARNYASRSRTRFATQMPFSKAMKGGKRAGLAAQVLSVEAKRAKRARATGVAEVDENGPPPAADGAARKASRTVRGSTESCLGACADTVAAAVGAAAVTTPAPTMMALARSAVTH